MRLVVILTIISSSSVWAQTVYRWTDKRNIVHYTNDLSRVPADAKVATTEGEGLTHMGSKSKPAASAESSLRRDPDSRDLRDKEEEWWWREQFQIARAKIDSLEFDVELERKALEGQVTPGPTYAAYSGGGRAPGLAVASGRSFSRGRRHPAPSHHAYVAYDADDAPQTRYVRSVRSLERAQEELRDLERRAANEAIPLEWRR